jgi:microcystin-dependent protein
MGDAYLGEIRLFAGNFAPLGWALCNGQLLPISENDALYALLGTTYGGDGQVTFGLPDFRGRVPVHTGSAYVMGQMAGSETVTLTINQIASHSHSVQASTNAGDSPDPTGRIWAKTGTNAYNTGPVDSTMEPASIAPNNGSNPHDNMLPFLTVNFIIALEGIFPSQG